MVKTWLNYKILIIILDPYLDHSWGLCQDQDLRDQEKLPHLVEVFWGQANPVPDCMLALVFFLVAYFHYTKNPPPKKGGFCFPIT